MGDTVDLASRPSSYGGATVRCDGIHRKQTERNNQLYPCLAQLRDLCPLRLLALDLLVRSSADLDIVGVQANRQQNPRQQTPAQKDAQHVRQLQESQKENIRPCEHQGVEDSCASGDPVRCHHVPITRFSTRVRLRVRRTSEVYLGGVRHLHNFVTGQQRGKPYYILPCQRGIPTALQGHFEIQMEAFLPRSEETRRGRSRNRRVMRRWLTFIRVFQASACHKLVTKTQLSYFFTLEINELP